MSAVGRREALDALHQAQKLQATLHELLVGAQRLRAQMDMSPTPRSPVEARRMLEEHQERKVSRQLVQAFPRPSPLPFPLLPLFLGLLGVPPCLSPPASHSSAASPPLLLPAGLLPVPGDLSPVPFQAELDSWTDSSSLARSTGQQLLTAGHPSTPDIRQALAGLEQELSSLEGTWQEHQLQLQQALELQAGTVPSPACILAPPNTACADPQPLVKAKAGGAAGPGTSPPLSALAFQDPGSPTYATGRVTPPAVAGPSADCLLPFPLFPAVSELCGEDRTLA